MDGRELDLYPKDVSVISASTYGRRFEAAETVSTSRGARPSGGGESMPLTFSSKVRTQTERGPRSGSHVAPMPHLGYVRTREVPNRGAGACTPRTRTSARAL